MRPGSRPDFARRRHLVFALLALLHAPMAMATGIVPRLVSTHPWTAQLDTLDRLIPLVFVAAIAWLAFEVFDTRAEVTVLPRRWADVGVGVVGVWLAASAVQIAALSQTSTAEIQAIAGRWTRSYTGEEGELLLGWLLVSILVSALAEELVYRALLLRALEGYLGRWTALLAHALVFELVHVVVYGYGFRGGAWAIAGVIYGYAFLRTRSLAVPVLLHAGTNLGFYVSVWWLSRSL
jgi:membrane protease YdiL (CAAX protease family)